MKRWLRLIRKLRWGGNKFYCPLCEAGFSSFWPSGRPVRHNARCPVCGSLERHRLLWVALRLLWERGTLKPEGRLLHVAPEPCIREHLAERYDYVSMDMHAASTMVRTDITSMCFPDQCFDAVICNHVLEHVPEDRKALAELFRVLRHGGWASIQVPMEKGSTREDPAVVAPADRERLYGQGDHVRQYGDDFRDRLREAGFELIELEKAELLDAHALEKLSVSTENSVILVKKT